MTNSTHSVAVMCLGIFIGQLELQACAPLVRTYEERSRGTFHLHGKPEIPV